MNHQELPRTTKNHQKPSRTIKNSQEPHRQINTHKSSITTNQLLGYDMFWGFRWMALSRRSELFLSYFLLSLQTVNMTLSTSLIANGRQLGCSESVILHCPLCPVKLSTEFFMGGALSTNCKYDFIHFTYCQWASTWMLRICHIALSAVPSKTEHRILYGWCSLYKL